MPDITNRRKLYFDSQFDTFWSRLLAPCPWEEHYGGMSMYKEVSLTS
jgi:hypothetical protein